jgi:hypothetical protein
MKNKQKRNLPFPPEVFLNLRTKRRHEVVEVHDNMDANVEEHEKCRVASTNKPEECKFRLE